MKAVIVNILSEAIRSMKAVIVNILSEAIRSAIAAAALMLLMAVLHRHGMPAVPALGYLASWAGVVLTGLVGRYVYHASTFNNAD